MPDFHGASAGSVWAVIKPFQQTGSASHVWGVVFSSPANPCLVVGYSATGQPLASVRTAADGVVTATGLDQIAGAGDLVLLGASVDTASGLIKLYVNGTFEAQHTITVGTTISTIVDNNGFFALGADGGAAPDLAPTMVAIDVGADLTAMSASDFDTIWRNMVQP